LPDTSYRHISYRQLLSANPGIVLLSVLRLEVSGEDGTRGYFSDSSDLSVYVALMENGDIVVLIAGGRIYKRMVNDISSRTCFPLSFTSPSAFQQCCHIHTTFKAAKHICPPASWRTRVSPIQSKRYGKQLHHFSPIRSTTDPIASQSLLNTSADSPASRPNFKMSSTDTSRSRESSSP
jgi:hypothetical protein